MKGLFRIGQVALAECAGAVHSRRALVILVLYLLSSVFCMVGTISILGKMEAELVNVLQLPESQRTGVVSATLWKSKPFQRMVKASLKNDLVYDDIVGRHPAELVYAWFAFLCAPLLAVLVAGNRVADDLRSGAVKGARGQSVTQFVDHEIQKPRAYPGEKAQKEDARVAELRLPPEKGGKENRDQPEKRPDRDRNLPKAEREGSFRHLGGVGGVEHR